MSSSTARALRTSALLFAVLGARATNAQIAKGASKFLGNITHQNSVRSDFGKYWNQITAENECKWGSIESSRGNRNFAGCDAVYKYAKDNKIPFKFHALVWGSQYPSWITSLSASEQKKSVEAWMDAVKARYPDIQMIDVVNEAVDGHAPAPYKDGLGGNGTTGYDWIINSFKMARERWPNAILIYNDYNVIRWDTDKVIKLVQAVKKADPKIIDALGLQAHGLEASTQYGFSALSATDLKAQLKKLREQSGLPLFISEYDISYTDDNTQKSVFSSQFPVMWESEYVVGITLWGYIYGQTWSQAQYAGLIKDGKERPALTWLKEYIPTKMNPPSDSPELLARLGGTSSIEARARATKPGKQGLVMRSLDGRMAMGVERDGVFREVSALGRN